MKNEILGGCLHDTNKNKMVLELFVSLFAGVVVGLVIVSFITDSMFFIDTRPWKTTRRRVIVPTASGHVLPPIIHQMYTSQELPPELETAHRTWVFNSNSKVKIWTDVQIEDFIKTKCAWIYETWQSLPTNRDRALLAKYCIMYVYGGLYADMDIHITDRRLVWKVIAMNEKHERPTVYISSPSTSSVGWIIPNHDYVSTGLFAATPKHPFWLSVIKYAVESLNMSHAITLAAKNWKEDNKNDIIIFSAQRTGCSWLSPISLSPLATHRNKPNLSEKYRKKRSDGTIKVTEALNKFLSEPRDDEDGDWSVL